MSYIDGMLCAVSNDKKEEFLAFSQAMTEVFKEYGATSVVDCWGDDVPEGEVTSMPMAVKAEAGETVVFSWACMKWKVPVRYFGRDLFLRHRFLRHRFLQGA